MILSFTDIQCPICSYCGRFIKWSINNVWENLRRILHPEVKQKVSNALVNLVVGEEWYDTTQLSLLLSVAGGIYESHSLSKVFGQIQAQFLRYSYITLSFSSLSFDPLKHFMILLLKLNDQLPVWCTCSYNYNFPFCIFAVRRPNKDAFVPVHLYGQLTQHKEGFSLLQQQVVECLCIKKPSHIDKHIVKYRWIQPRCLSLQECIGEFFQCIKCLELHSDGDVLKMKTALWAVVCLYSAEMLNIFLMEMYRFLIVVWLFWCYI